MTKSGMFLESKKRWIEFKQGYYNVASKFKYFIFNLYFRVISVERYVQIELHSCFDISYRAENS
jgi:hypothetical protein